MSKKLYIILASLAALFLMTLGVYFYHFQSRQKFLETDFLDVGQGDSVLIKTPFGQNILVDGGPDKKVLQRLGENLPFWDKKIDLMILTHPHDDHVTGLVEVVKRYEVEKILYTGVVHDGPNFLAWLSLVKDKKIPVVIIDHRQTIKLGDDCELDILSPEESLLGKGVDNLNNTSLVMKISYGRTKILLAGDIEEEAEQRLIGLNMDLSADVFKASHHGSNTSNTEEFLRKVNPSIVVIEVGKKNSYEHPSGRVIKRLERAGARIFRTDLDGTVKIISDGQSIEVKPF